MIRKTILSLCVVVTMAMPLMAGALNVTTTAGRLAAEIGDDTDITTLNVSGTINAADFDYIQSHLTSLSTLDLTDATVVAYTGDKVLAGRGDFPADELPAYALFGSRVASLTLPSSLKSIGSSAMAASAIESVMLPESLTAIGGHAFNGCVALKSVSLPASVVTMGEGAFAGCTSLTEVVVGSGLSELPTSTFSGCKSLSTVTLPATLTVIGNEALKGCTALSTIDVPVAVTTIGSQAMYASGLKSLTLSGCKSLKSIGDYAFARCEALTEAKLPDVDLTMGQGVFFDDTALRDVTLPSSTVAIPSFTFKGAQSINAQNVLPESVATIGDYALMGWSNVKQFTLPESLNHLGTGAMENWAALDTLNAYTLQSVPALGESVWEGIDQANVILYVDIDRLEDFKSAEQWNDFSVRVKTSSVDNAVTIDPTGGNVVTFDLTEHTLYIKSSGEPIETVAIYDLTGRQWLVRHDNSAVVAVNLESLPATVFIVNVTLTDGSVANLKITK